MRRALSTTAIEGARAAVGYVLQNSGPVAETTTTTAPSAHTRRRGGQGISSTADDAIIFFGITLGGATLQLS